MTETLTGLYFINDMCGRCDEKEIVMILKKHNNINDQGEVINNQREINLTGHNSFEYIYRVCLIVLIVEYECMSILYLLVIRIFDT